MGIISISQTSALLLSQNLHLETTNIKLNIWYISVKQKSI